MGGFTHVVVSIAAFVGQSTLTQSTDLPEIPVAHILVVAALAPTISIENWAPPKLSSLHEVYSTDTMR